MAELTLRLSPYETPLRRRPDMDSEAVFFETNCFGRVREFVGQSINEDGYGNILFCQLRDEPQRGSFVYSGKDKNSAQFYKDFGRTSPARTISHLKDCIEPNYWGRYFVLDRSLNFADSDNGYNTLFLNWNGLGMFHKDGGSYARFRWNNPCAEEIWDASAAELLTRIQRQFQERASEPHFAIWWASLSEAEELDFAFPLKRGNYQEWSDVCELLPISLITWPNNYPGKLYVRFDVSGKVVAQFYIESVRSSSLTVETAALTRLFSWLRLYFAPQVIEQSSTDFLCVRQFLQKDSHTICQVRIVEPTQHERLEALLQLRDWLADKATPAEIEALLRAE